MAAIANEAVSGRPPIDKPWTPPYVSTTGPADARHSIAIAGKCRISAMLAAGAASRPGDEIKDVT
jgi:hypothetical protein